MATQTTFTSRHYAGERDLQSIVDLWNLVDATDKVEFPISVDDLQVEVNFPGMDQQRDIRLWEDAEGRLVVYGRVSKDNNLDVAEGRFVLCVHPETRNQGLEEEVFNWAEERMREVGRDRNKAPVLYTFARDYETYTRPVIEGRGYTPARYFFRMARPLNEPIPEPQFPEGFTMRAIEGKHEMQNWVDMFNQSFIDHWNHHDLTLEEALHYTSSKSYAQERDLIATAPDGTFAAFCLCIIDPEKNAIKQTNEGWIDLLGTRRGYRWRPLP